MEQFSNCIIEIDYKESVCVQQQMIQPPTYKASKHLFLPSIQREEDGEAGGDMFLRMAV